MIVREVHKEIKWNKSKKSELEKVLAKQRKASEEVSDEHQNEVEHEFKKVLSERARRSEKLSLVENQGPAELIEKHDKKNKDDDEDDEGGTVSIPGDGEVTESEEDSEFAKVFAELRGKKL